MNPNEKPIFDIITDCSINERMDSILLHNEEYLKIQDKINKHNEIFDKLNLSKDERLIIDKLICSHAEIGAFYGKMTYKQGFRDCVSLLREMNLIKAS